MKKGNSKQNQEGIPDSDNFAMDSPNGNETTSQSSSIIEEIYTLLEEIKKQKDILKSKGII